MENQMNNEHDTERRQRLEAHITQISKQIIVLEEQRKNFIDLLNQPIRALISLTKMVNTTLIHDYHICDYCFDNFDWGICDIHYHDQDKLTVCPKCAASFQS